MAVRKTKKKAAPAKPAISAPEAAAPSNAPSTVPHESIAERAYRIWEASGYAHGQDHHHWFQAERELRG
jgi:hypothetical protein